MTSQAPIVALDVDGVVLALSRLPMLQILVATNRLYDINGELIDDAALNDLVEKDVELHREVWADGAFHNPWDVLFPGLDKVSDRLLVVSSVGPWVRSLLARGVEVAWATTWEHTANDYIAPLLGIPALPVAVSSATTPVDDSIETSFEWKTQALRNFAGDRPIVFVDDNMPYGWLPVTEDFLRPTDGKSTHSLAVCTDRTIGLTRPEMAVVDTWLAQLV